MLSERKVSQVIFKNVYIVFFAKSMQCFFHNLIAKKLCMALCTFT